jgi:hypothetical protein
MENLIKISENELKDLCRLRANNLVGKALKRVDISDNKDELKRQIKELVYEELRELSLLLVVYNRGFEYADQK